MDLDAALAAIEKGKVAAVYLVAGEEFLVRRAAEALVDKLVPAQSRDLNLAVVDGAAGAREIAGHMDTLPMFRGRKVVLVEGAEFLSKKKDKSGGLARARELWQAGRQRDAARRLLALAQSEGLAAPEMILQAPGVGADDRAWMSDAVAFAKQNQISAPAEESELLVRSIEKGPAGENVLVLTCAAFDAALPLAKLIAKKGAVIERAVERTGRGAQGLDYAGIVAEVLGPLGKKLTRDAEMTLKARVGGQMRLLAGELTKLADYVGEKKVIEAADVELLVASVAEEDFFELANALGDRELGRLLTLLDDDLSRGKHPLMILGGMAAAVRKLLVESARLARVPAARGARELSYNDYQRSVWPEIEKQIEEAGDRAGSPYGAYMTYKRARKFSVPSLSRALCACADADLALKSGGGGRLVLESLARGVLAK